MAFNATSVHSQADDGSSATISLTKGKVTGAISIAPSAEGELPSHYRLATTEAGNYALVEEQHNYDKST